MALVCRSCGRERPGSERPCPACGSESYVAHHLFRGEMPPDASSVQRQDWEGEASYQCDRDAIKAAVKSKLIIRDWLIILMGCIALIVLGTVIYSFVAGSDVDEADVYRHTAAPTGGGARDLAVMTTEDGQWDVTETSDDSVMPGSVSLGALTGGESQLAVYADALDSRNISIHIGEIGYTDYAGLRFTQPATANIWGDGTVELNRAGIIGTDPEGTEWISRGVRLDGQTAILMVRR